MKQFQCEICGGNTVIQLDEKTFECQDCGLQYDISEVEKLIVVGEENHWEQPSQEEIVVPLGVAINSEPTDETIENQDEFKLEEPVSNDETGVDETNYINSSESATDSAICEDTTETDIEANEEDTKITSNTTELDVEEPATDSSKIEEQSNGENQEQTTNAIIVEDSVPEPIENVVKIDVPQDENDEINELKIDEKGETGDKIAVVPWFRNKKVIIPSIIGLALVVLITVLSINLLPGKNIPISGDDSSDVQNTESNISQNSTSDNVSSEIERNASITDVSENQQSSEQKQQNNTSKKPVINADPNDVARVRTFQDAGRNGKEESNAFGDVIKVYYYYDSGCIAEEHSYIYNSNRKNIKCMSSYYSQDGTKVQYHEQDFEKSTFYEELYYSEGNHKGKLSRTQVSKQTTYSGGSLNEGYHEISDYGYYSNGKCASIITHIWENGVCISSREKHYDEYGNEIEQ